MKEMGDEEILQIMIASQEKAYQAALETAIRTGTPLIGSRNGKPVEIWPKYKYVLVPIKASKKSKKKAVRKKKSQKSLKIKDLQILP